MVSFLFLEVRFRQQRLPVVRGAAAARLANKEMMRIFFILTVRKFGEL